MYAIKCDGNFVHSVVPDDPVGLAIKLAAYGSNDFIKFSSTADCSALIFILEEHFPYDEFRIVKV